VYINISLYHTKYDWSTHQFIHIDMTILINLRNLISLPRHEKNGTKVLLVRSSKWIIFKYGICLIRIITKLPNSEQSYKGKVKTHKYINRLGTGISKEMVG